MENSGFQKGLGETTEKEKERESVSERAKAVQAERSPCYHQHSEIAPCMVVSYLQQQKRHLPISSTTIISAGHGAPVEEEKEKKLGNAKPMPRALRRTRSLLPCGSDDSQRINLPTSC